MKQLKIDKMARISLVLYALLFFVALTTALYLINFVNNYFINPIEHEQISLGGTDIPIMRPFEDTFFYINPQEFAKDPDLNDTLQNNEDIFETIYGVTVSVIFILLFLQLARFINSIKYKVFYSPESMVNVKTISFILFAWVIVDFIAYQCLQLVIPISVVEERINYITMKESIFQNLTHSIDIPMLFIAYAFYTVSVVFKTAADLKEQTDLTV